MRARSISIAGLILIALVGWIASGPGMIVRDNDALGSADSAGGNSDPQNPTTLDGHQALAGTADAGLGTRVRIALSEAKLYRPEVVVRGVTRASRVVAIRSEVKGRVVGLPISKGQVVEKAELIARLDIAERGSALRQAQAQVAQARLEYEAVARLRKQGYRAEANVATAKASLEGALSDRDRIQRAIANTAIRAPFSGVMSQRVVEQGDYVMEGQVVATVVDLDPIVALGQVSERDRARVPMGADATVRLLDNREYQGTVRYLASVADPATRTFGVEVELANPRHEIVAGLTAQMSIAGQMLQAHLVPASILTLDANGRLAVKLVDEDNRIQLAWVKAVGQSGRGLWLTGLPKQCRVVTVGGEYVEVGDVVVPEDTGRLPVIGANTN